MFKTPSTPTARVCHNKYIFRQRITYRYTYYVFHSNFLGFYCSYVFYKSAAFLLSYILFCFCWKKKYQQLRWLRKWVEFVCTANTKTYPNKVRIETGSLTQSLANVCACVFILRVPISKIIYNKKRGYVCDVVIWGYDEPSDYFVRHCIIL